MNKKQKGLMLHIWFWRPSLLGRSAAQQLVSSAVALALVVGVLTTSLLFAQPAAAATRQQHSTTASLLAPSGTGMRLEVFEAATPAIYHKWSDDNGATWSDWASLGGPPVGYDVFNQTPVVVSDGVAHLIVIARDVQNYLWENDYYNGSWSGWQLYAQYIFVGGAQTPANYYDIISDATLTSWGLGRRDLFVYVKNEASGAIRLLHRWGDNYAWTGGEFLGSSLAFQGSPAAVSWGPGRIDVFGWGPANELEHLWYDASNGGWHDWASLGGHLASSPTVASGGAGGWDLYVRNPNGGLSTISYRSWGYWGWFDLDSNTITSAPATAETPGNVFVFALDLNGKLAYNRWFNQWWFGWSEVNPPSHVAPAAVSWWPSPVAVPNVVSLDQDSATTALTEAGLVLGSVTLDNTCRDVAKAVLFQNPTAGASVTPGTAVNLRVSSGVDSKGNQCVFQ